MGKDGLERKLLIFISLLVGTIYGTTWLVVKYKKKKIEPQDV